MEPNNDDQTSGALDEDAHDQLAKITRGLTSLVPLAGGLLGEILTTAIPNQRIDRIAKYLGQLEPRLAKLEADKQRRIISDKERIDLIEEGGYQAARATSDERIARIAEAVSRGLASDEADILRRKRLVLLLRQIDDDELALLNAYGQSYGGPAHEAWERISRPPPAHMGSTIDEIDRDQLFETGKATLLRLGLLKKNFPFVKRGELPEFDKSEGDFKHSLEISYLGRLLLREIGLPSPVDTQDEGAAEQ